VTIAIRKRVDLRYPHAPRPRAREYQIGMDLALLGNTEGPSVTGMD
jgi:hypothetical protein